MDYVALFMSVVRCRFLRLFFLTVPLTRKSLSEVNC